jgi:hypothetical protein
MAINVCLPSQPTSLLSHPTSLTPPGGMQVNRTHSHCVNTHTALLLLLLQFITSAQPSSISSKSSRRSKPSAPTADPPSAAAAAAPAVHSLPAQLQQRWHETALPAILQHLLTCYSLLIGSTCSTCSTSSTAHGSTMYSHGHPGSHAMPGQQQQLHELGTRGCLLPALTHKQQASIDQVRWRNGTMGKRVKAWCQSQP